MTKPFCWTGSFLIEKKSSNGMGTFAKKNIKKGMLLMIFGGYVLSHKEEKGLPKKISDLGIQIENGFTIGPISASQNLFGNFVNHSCEPNAGIRGQISLYSMRNIKKGEEICFDYGTVLFGSKNKPTYEMKCHCHSKTCRNVITDLDWKKPELQKKYKGYFPYYINDLIT